MKRITRNAARQINTLADTINRGIFKRHFWGELLRHQHVAVCIRPGTELSFESGVKCSPIGVFPWRRPIIEYRTAIFRQINQGRIACHHDALEFPDGQTVLLTLLTEGQHATVLQLPAEPKSVLKAQDQAVYAD